MAQQAWLTQSGSGVTGHLRQVHRGHGLYTEIIESRKHVRSRPARSSTGVCYRGAPHQCPRGSNASRRVCSLTKGALYALGLIGQVYSLHHPVGKSLFGDSLSLLLSSKADKELVWGPEALHAVYVNMQSTDGTEQSNGWVCLLPGQCLQVHHLIPEGHGGNFGHISRPGSQDNARVSRPEFMAQIANRKFLQVTYPLDRSQCSEEHCRQRQKLKLYWLQRLEGLLLQGRQDRGEIPRGYQVRAQMI